MAGGSGVNNEHLDFELAVEAILERRRRDFRVLPWGKLFYYFGGLG
jgi:hypothetical protein